MTRPHCRAGLGVPVVVDRANSGPQRPGDLYLPPKIAFNATAVMRPSSGATGLSDLQVVLELHNPQCDPPVDCPTGPHPLAADISAAFAYRELDLNLEPSPFEMFVYPDSNPAFEGLYFLEPYQPGKIPVVFVHGLMSSPRTWIDTANDLRANPEFNARYQIWAFDYATGKPFVRAAAELRQALCDVTSELAAAGDDPALREIVLVGHSMGGLISKLQVTQSGDDLWNSIACEPIDQVALAPAVRNLAYEVFFFEPLPQVRRVIFVGTPHRGAAAATRLVGQISSTLVRRSPEELAMHRQIVADNRGAFRFSLQRRLPTSIDMLEPCNSMLRAIDCLPISDAVHIHTIAGTGKYTVGVAAGDGVVPLKSAVHPLAESELLVKASHTQLHRHPESVDEIWRILDEHARECR
ncbi:MAG: alpha/beta fold hydrolase [Planctomycetaceae bacterium]|nr:MAG: alpha/beta fold hydrolase [Planctomycetaceae bacterium]